MKRWIFAFLRQRFRWFTTTSRGTKPRYLKG